MIDTLKWFAAAEALGLAFFPLAHFLFPHFRDRGWGFAKPLGLLFASYAVWMLSYLRILPNAGLSYWLIAAVAAVAGGWYVRRRRAEFARLIRQHWRALAVGELLFLLFFLAWTAYRAYDPSIAGTEKPMDFMFLNASARAGHAPPADPWLSGQPVAYYYFGYWMMAALSLMSATPTYVAFNLSIAVTAALAAGAMFTLVYAMVGADGGTRRGGILAGAAGAVLLVVAANLAAFWEFASLYDVGTRGFYDWLAIDGLQRGQPGVLWRPDGFWWWWRASRIINTFDASGNGLDFTIQEFPSFSFILGDLHPHVLSIPFVVVGVGVVFNLMLSPARWGLGWVARHPARALALALIVGAAGFINAWDLGLLALLLAAVATLKVYRAAGVGVFGAGIRAAPAVAAVVAGALVLYAPFYFGTFTSQVPPGAPIGSAAHSTRPVHFLTVWGLALALVAPFVIAVAARPVRRYWAWSRASLGAAIAEAPGLASRPRPDLSPVLLAALAVAVPYFVWAAIHLEFDDGARPADMVQRLIAILPLSVAFFALSLALFHRARRAAADGALFALLTVALAMYLLLGVELIFVRDLFNDRMNTVFKVYYQVWILLAGAGGYALHYWRSRHRCWPPRVRAASRTGAWVAAVLSVGALYYPVAAAFSKADSFKSEPTLDGLAHVTKSVPAERAAIEYLRGRARTGETVLEGVGGAYTEYGRVSSSTGIPTVLGWPGHELQWRGSSKPFEGREEDVERIYTTSDPDEARRLLDRYHVSFVYIGERERSKYRVDIAKFDEIGTRVFDQDGVVIFRVGERNPGN